jgi:uncharacterized protein YbjT (DUF2867 family)
VTVLVAGARGRIAAAVISQLLEAGVPVRAASTDPDALRLPDAIEVHRATVRQPESLGGALRGVRKVFLYADPDGVDGFVAAARQAGVEHVVLLSSLTATRADADQAADRLTLEADPIAWRHVVVERALADSGIPWTFVRPGMFATNTLRWAPTIRADHEVRLTRPAAQAAPMHEQDVAAVAVTALLEPGHERARYALTGPESLSQRRQVQLIGAAIGQSVRLVEIGDEEAREQIARSFGPAIADRLVANLIATDGVPVPILDTMSQVLGRPARKFAEWAADHAAEFS